MICGVVGNPSPAIVSYSLSFGGRKNIVSGGLGNEVELQKDVECRLTIKRCIQRGTNIEGCYFPYWGPGVFKLTVTRNKNTVPFCPLYP